MKKILYCFFYLSIILIGFEIILSIHFNFFLKDKNSDQFNEYRLYSKGKLFKNYKDFYMYYPDLKKRVIKAYTSNDIRKPSDVIIANDYFIETNSSGLIMKNNIKNKKNNIFIIGDSLTEGEGYEPWFYKLENDYDENQLINLGILGTGPKHWQKILEHVIKENNIYPKKTIVNIIINDLYRDNWIFSETELKCLEELICNYSGSFHGISFENDNSYASIKKKIFEKSNLKKPQKPFFTGLKYTIQKSRLISVLYWYFYQNLILNQNLESLSQINEISNYDIFYNLITYREFEKRQEFSGYKKGYDKFISFLNNKNVEYQICNIPKELFTIYDSHHPNSDGYNVILECNKKILDKLQTF